MWCDTFDADLLVVVPGAAEALGETAGIRLETYSRLTDGKINHPSCWNTDEGFSAFFWTHPDFRPAGCWVTSEKVVECTFLEVIRDEWVHSCVVTVNSYVIWRPPVRLMERLMSDLRGWTILSDEEREDIRESVRRSLRAAAERVTAVVAR